MAFADLLHKGAELPCLHVVTKSAFGTESFSFKLLIEAKKYADPTTLFE